MPKGEEVAQGKMVKMAAEWLRVGLERPHFLPLARGQKTTGSLQPNQSDERSKRLVGQTGVRAMQSFPVALERHPHSSLSSSKIEVEVKSSSPVYFSGNFTNHFTRARRHG
jgi:hypothetical protein